jgi:hypothetical protein
MADLERFEDPQDSVSCRACPAHPNFEARLAAVRRLPAPLLPIAITDPEPAIRREVARLVDEEWLAVLAWDRDPGVRLAVAKRLRPEQLSVLVGDSDAQVRAMVASRGETAALAVLADDAAASVRRIAQQRLNRLIHASARYRCRCVGRAEPKPLLM